MMEKLENQIRGKQEKVAEEMMNGPVGKADDGDAAE
jgi:recombination protein RecA